MTGVTCGTEYPDPFEALYFVLINSVYYFLFAWTDITV